MGPDLTFRDIIRNAISESGSGYFDEAVVTASDIVERTDTARMARWVSDAWIHIQNRPDWRFQRDDFTWRLDPGVSRYTGDPDAVTHSLPLMRAPDASPAAPDWGNWFTRNVGDTGGYDRLSGSWVVNGPVGDAPTTRYGDLPFVEWPEFRRQYIYVDTAALGDVPLVFSIDPHRRVHIAPTPKDPYDVFGDYKLAPQVLTAFGDVPRGLPVNYRPMIRYKAMEFYYLYDETADGLQVAQIRFGEMYSLFQTEFTPPAEMRGSFVGV